MTSLGLGVIAMLTAGCAAAEGGSLDWNSFGTLAATNARLDWGDYTQNNLQPHGTGRSQTVSIDTDSRLGGQLSWHGGDFGAQVQIVSEYRPDGSFDPYLSWANLTYAVNSQWKLRIGRIGLDSFLFSDSRLIGLTYHTVRLPVEVYRLLPLYDSDGVDSNVRWQWGDWRQTTEVVAGHKTVVNVQRSHVHSTDVYGIFHTAEQGPWTLHMAYQQRRVDNQSPPLGHFYSMGLRYDDSNWIAYGEAVRTTSFTALGRPLIREGAYATVGYRWGVLTPFALISGLQQRSNSGQLPVAQQSQAIGLRWDWARHADLKIQWDHVQPSAGSYGTEQNVLPGTPKGQAFQVFTLTTDFAY
ncbi:MAG: hypothetical protein JO218_14960 [Burkholderiales bacterium]|nr:hypothetical protein [Burkholderiales bacterium]